MAEVLFFVAGAGAIAGALGVIWATNPFFSVLSLVFHLLSLAALFLLLHAQFLAAAQVIVYAGAVMVLYVFVVAYVGAASVALRANRQSRLLATLFAAALGVELFIAVLGSGLQAVKTEGAPLSDQFGTPAYIGELLLTKYLLAFEVASFLLLIGAVGAVLLARRRGGLPEDERRRISVYDVIRPGYTGTMAEGVGAAYHHQSELEK
jgi:NADH-quinone oxidoreductase subunit J